MVRPAAFVLTWFGTPGPTLRVAGNLHRLNSRTGNSGCVLRFQVVIERREQSMSEWKPDRTGEHVLQSGSC
jgi:hypothetical protein